LRWRATNPLGSKCGCTTCSATFLCALWDGDATGTGNIDSFVQIGANTDITQAYNTTVNGTFNKGAPDYFNHALLLTQIPIVTIDGIDYYEFLLDINQSGSDLLLSLDEIQVFTLGTANQSTEAFASGVLAPTDATLVYNLDANEDSDAVEDHFEHYRWDS